MGAEVGQGASSLHLGPESCALLCESCARARVRVHVCPHQGGCQAVEGMPSLGQGRKSSSPLPPLCFCVHLLFKKVSLAGPSGT